MLLEDVGSCGWEEGSAASEAGRSLREESATFEAEVMNFSEVATMDLALDVFGVVEAPLVLDVSESVSSVPLVTRPNITT